MGSLPSPPRPTTPPPSPENSPSGYRVYVPFCVREPMSNTNISNWLESYNPLDHTWTYVSSIPELPENHALKGFAMVSLGRSIYIIGGRLCRKERAHVSDKYVEPDPDEVLSSVLRYDICTKQWSLCAPLGVARYDFACTTFENKIFVAGGQSTLPRARGISAAEVYDSDLNEWTPLPNMSTLRYKCVGVTWQGKIHVVGGFAERVDSDRSQPFISERSSAEVFDMQTGKWDLNMKMWQLDVPPNQIVELDGKLFSSGDCLNAWKGHIDAYDGVQNMWTVVEASRLKTLSSAGLTSDGHIENWPQIQRLYLTVAPIGTHLYFLAGYQMAGESSRSMSMVHIFDTSAARNAWRSYEPIEEVGGKELCSHCCVVQLS
ncbi:hypothetical protein L1049_009552 [Liquidambar formosana]|uniref:Uncharacterized protein n=1 Tax=Liquidambar formosana TaxID=63359 RepID=A0AAP0R441_LIQFO